MEIKTTQNKEHKVILENRKKLTITGISKVENVNLNQISALIDNAIIIISGNNLHIDKLDVSSGHIEISGEINAIKYSDKKPNLFRRMFR